MSTIAWLVFRRLLYGPGWWFLYLPARLIWSLSIFLVQVSFGALAALVGLGGRANQSSALSAVSESISTSLIVQPSATGRIPKFHPEMSAPTIAVGGGGAGAKDQQNNPSRAAGILTEQVGKMTEESRESKKHDKEAVTNDAPQAEGQGTVLRERNNDEPPNPKKRMWEENTDPLVQGDLARNEL